MVGLATLLVSTEAFADPCPTNLPNPVYGAGGSAVTATLAAVASAVAADTTIFFWDPGACTGYQSFIDGQTKPAYFKFWDATGKQTQCEPAGTEPLSFAHMGNTPLLCPAKQPLPAGFGRFGGPIQTINIITHKRSQYDSISAEAFYFIYGFGPGAAGKSVAPWTVPGAAFARATNSFVHQFLAAAFNVPPTGFKVPTENFPNTNPLTVQGVFSWGEANNPDAPIGYVSGSAADKGEDDNQVKTLAVQFTGQTCGYLPDSARGKKDKVNVRNGQYPLFTPGQFYAKVDGAGAIQNQTVSKLIHWFDGTVAAPNGLDITSIVIKSGDIPLCAMQANRPDGDLSALVSFAPPNPCNGYFEFTATGTTTHTACGTDVTKCNQAKGEQCRFGYCEPY